MRTSKMRTLEKQQAPKQHYSGTSVIGKNPSPLPDLNK